MMEYLRNPEAIYAQSFKTIRAEADLDALDPLLHDVAVRMIHASGLIDLPQHLRASEDVVEKIEFALVHPPFVAAVTAPDGAVWLEKSRTYGDSLQSWQLISRAGSLTQVFRITGEGRLLALAPAVALVAEPYSDGYRLLTYRIPQ